jgi:hypothetical protein
VPRSLFGRLLVTSAPLFERLGQFGLGLGERFVQGWRNVRREESSCAGEHSDVDVLALVNFPETLAEEVVKLLVQSIQLLGPVECDDCDTIAISGCDKLFVGHVCVF